MTDPTVATEAALDIESIKKMLDGVDPEAMLPEMSSVFEKILLICRVAVIVGPVILLLMGVAYVLLAPKEANYYFGYRCYYGMGSAHAWRFTQRIAGILLGILGLVLTIVMVIISGGFTRLEMMDMVWTTVRCLLWQVVLTILVNVAIHLIVMFWFDRKGELRTTRVPKKKE